MPSATPTTNAGVPLIRASGLGKTYGSGPAAVHALQDVALDVQEGDFIVFLGPSGCGKTTLLNIIGGLESATTGTITVASRDLTQLGRTALTAYRRDTVGFVYQFFNLIPTLTARENVELAAQLGCDRDAAGILEDVGLGHRLDNFPGEMSGGEQQRVAIARALVRRPAILLCDEPTGELDLETGKKVLALLQRFNREHRTTILLVTHNSVIARLANRVVRMRGGTIASIEPNAEPANAEDLSW